MIYGRYIYTIPMVYKPTFTSLGGAPPWPKHWRDDPSLGDQFWLIRGSYAIQQAPIFAY